MSSNSPVGDSGRPAVHVPAPRSAKSPICLSGVSGEEGSRGAAPAARVPLPAEFWLRLKRDDA